MAALQQALPRWALGKALKKTQFRPGFIWDPGRAVKSLSVGFLGHSRVKGAIVSLGMS